MQTCPKCKSQNMMTGLDIVDQAGHYIRLGVRVYDKPDALLFKGKHVSPLRCNVCGDCGYVENYVENPQELYSAYLEAQRQR